MAQKVATAYKLKSRRDNLPRPNCDGDGKADNKRQAFINSDTRCFKIQTGDMDPPPPRQGLYVQVRAVHAYRIVTILHIMAQLLTDQIKLKGL